MWNDELKTFNDFLCLSSNDFWYLKPFGAHFPQIALMAQMP